MATVTCFSCERSPPSLCAAPFVPSSLCLRPCVSFFLLQSMCASNKKGTSRQPSTRNVANLAQGTTSRSCDRAIFGSIPDAHVGPYLRNLQGVDPTHAKRDTPYLFVGDYTLRASDTTFAIFGSSARRTPNDIHHHITVGDYPLKNNGSHIDASLSRQPLVKGERLVRAEMNAVIIIFATAIHYHF